MTSTMETAFTLLLIAALVLGALVILGPRINAALQDAAAALPAPAFSAAAPRPAELDTNGALPHVQDRHGSAAAQVLEALQMGACIPDIYVEGDCQVPNGDGRPAMMVCRILGQQFFVALRYDALRGMWVAMTAFEADDDYVQRQIRQFRCHLDLAITSLRLDFEEVIHAGDE